MADNTVLLNPDGSPYTSTAVDPAGAASVPPPAQVWPPQPVSGTIAPAYQPPALDPPQVSMHEVQQADELGVQQDDPSQDPNKVLFKVFGSDDPGRYFRMSDRVGLMPLLRFAHSARGGVDSTDPKALIALYDMIADCVDQNRPQRLKIDPETKQGFIDPETGQPAMEDAGPSEWDLFQDYATEQKADDEDLMEFVGTVIEKLSARSKARRGNSSAGRAPTSPNSKDASPSPGTVPATGGRVPEGMEGLVSVGSLARGQS